MSPASASPDPTSPPRLDVVVPTVGRATLDVLLASLIRSLPARTRIIVADDRPDGRAPLPTGEDPRMVVLRTGGRGPAAARNAGWRLSTAPWVAFVDDDIDLPVGWLRALEADLAAAGPTVAAVQGQVEVPLPAGRAPSDWERNVRGLEDGRWITADLAIRRSALHQVGGFDERFPRAYREDSDLALRLLDQGWCLQLGRRHIRHPVRRAPWWVSVGQQRGNADDVLIERLRGRDWRARLGAPTGTLARHRITVLAGIVALVAAAVGQWAVAGAASGWWLVRTVSFAWIRIAPGPRTPREIVTMAVTSIAIPPTACIHRLRGYLRWAVLSRRLAARG
jgi:glycosyltransferase involved in cell wall biosynthesis